MSLVSLLYVSRSRLGGTAFERAGLESILNAARRNNAARGLTGALLIDDGQFIQVLEGPRAVVESCFEDIGRDPRHDEVQLIAMTPILSRRFERWTMADLTAQRTAASPLGMSVAELRRLETGRAGTILDAMLDLAICDPASACADTHAPVAEASAR